VVNFTPGKEVPSTHWIRGRSGRGGEEKEISVPAGNRTPVVQSATQSSGNENRMVYIKPILQKNMKGRNQFGDLGINDRII
jgi:hypothetical protein